MPLKPSKPGPCGVLHYCSELGSSPRLRGGVRVEFLLLYGALHVTLLIPVRVSALLTLASTHWETR